MASSIRSATAMRALCTCIAYLVFRGDAGAQGTQSDLIERLAIRWRWEIRWGQGIGLTKIADFERKRLEVKRTVNLVAICLPHVDYCSAYTINSEGLGQTIAQGRCSIVGDSEDCVSTFWHATPLIARLVKGHSVETDFRLIDFSMSDERTPGTERGPDKETLQALINWLTRKTDKVPLEKAGQLVVPVFSPADPEIYVVWEREEPAISAILLIGNDHALGTFIDLGSITSQWPRYSILREKIYRNVAWKGRSW
jgi:hypothetical protein